MSLVALVGCVLFGLTRAASAQAAFPFGPIGVGTSQSLSTTVSFTASGTFNQMKVLTQGSPNLDFTEATPQAGSCHLLTTLSSVTANVTTCTVTITFTPQFPGVRTGAIVILDSNNVTLAIQPLSGIGTGPLSVMDPGEITTLAGNTTRAQDLGATSATSFPLNEPAGAVTDAAGNIYISDSLNNQIQMVVPSGTPGLAGTISTIANTAGTAGFSGDGGLAINAGINQPGAILVDGAGNIYFADTGNHAIRRIDAFTHKITTVAGTLGSSGNSGYPGPATSAHLFSPQSIAFDANNNLFIADTGNNSIRRVDAASGVITTLTTGLDEPFGLTVSASDLGIYVADYGDSKVYRINPGTGVASVVAGTGASDDCANGVQATNAGLSNPTSVVTDPAGNLYIADSDNNCIRRVNGPIGPSSRITTVAGNGVNHYVAGDNTPIAATSAILGKPDSIYLDGAGNLFIADTASFIVREVSATRAAIVYPVMKEGKVSAPIAQGVDNDGNANLTFSFLPFSLTTVNAQLDAPSTTCVIATPLSTSGAGASCVLGVDFAPQNLGQSPPQTGTLVISSNSANDLTSTPTSVDLSGSVLTVDPTSIAVTPSQNPIGAGLGVTFTAHITGPNLVTGTVQFFDGATPLGSSVTIVAANANVVTLTASFSVLGSHSITAVYSGDNLNAASTSPVLTEIVEKATTLSLASSAVPGTVFNQVTFTATLSGAGSTPTVGIVFTSSDGSFPSTSEPLVVSGPNMVATFTTTPAQLAVGSHTIVATFAGDANNFGSSASLTETVVKAGSSTSLGTSINVLQFSNPITFTATVTGNVVSTPTGSLQFKDLTTGTILATVPLNSAGVATYINTNLAAGTHAISAIYLGDTDYLGSTSTQTITETIDVTPTVTVISSSTLSTIARSPVTLTAHVTTTTGSVPGGSVTFMNGNILVGSATLSNGFASFTSTNLAVGVDNLTAIYSGDSNDTTSTSAPTAVTIAQDPTTTVVSSTQNPVLTLTALTISATVADGSTQTAGGSVTFYEDGIPVGVSQLSAGVATLDLAFLPVGSHSFSATYAGDSLDLASSSTVPLVEQVQLRPTTDTVTTTQTSLTGGQQFTIIAVIRSAGLAGSVAPTGTVTFMAGTSALATTAVDATGVATVTVLLSGATAVISSTYSGDINYAASSSVPDTVSIGPAPDFSLNVTPSTFQMQSKQHNTISVTMSSVKDFTDVFSLGCLGLPQAATCTFSSDNLTLPAGGSSTVSLTVDTGDPLLGGTSARNEPSSGANRILACFLPGGLLLGLVSLRVRRVRAMGLLRGLLLLLCAAGVMTGLSGCGSLQVNGTPAGSYSFQITAHGQTGIIQSFTVTMTITQ